MCEILGTLKFAWVGLSWPKHSIKGSQKVTQNSLGWNMLNLHISKVASTNNGNIYKFYPKEARGICSIASSTYFSVENWVWSLLVDNRLRVILEGNGDIYG